MGRLSGLRRGSPMDQELLRKSKSQKFLVAAKLLGKIGGLTRAERLTPKRRRAIAKKGGLAGGLARAAVLSAKRRRAIAKKAVKARWASQRNRLQSSRGVSQLER